MIRVPVIATNRPHSMDGSFACAVYHALDRLPLHGRQASLLLLRVCVHCACTLRIKVLRYSFELLLPFLLTQWSPTLLPCLALPCLALFDSALPCPTLPCPALPFPALPCHVPAFPYPALPRSCLTLPRVATKSNRYYILLVTSYLL